MLRLLKNGEFFDICSCSSEQKVGFVRKAVVPQAIVTSECQGSDVTKGVSMKAGFAWHSSACKIPSCSSFPSGRTS